MMLRKYWYCIEVADVGLEIMFGVKRNEIDRAVDLLYL
jgi:hypothetical protein